MSTTPTVTLSVGPTRILVPSTPNGTIGPGISLVPFIKHHLTEYEWSPTTRTSIATYNYTVYDPKKQLAALPRHCLEVLQNYLNPLCTIKLKELPVITPKNIAIPLKKNVVPREHQVSILDFLTSGNNFLPVSMFTGGGKTVVAIMALSALRHPGIIVLGSLIDQWYRSILQFTTLKSDQISVIKGNTACYKLLRDVTHKNYRPKIIIFSLRTFIYYARKINGYAEFFPLEDLVRLLGVGVCIKDEVHQNFHANATADLFLDLKYNIYLSATYQRNNYHGRRIFDMVFPKQLRFGGHLSKKHCKVVMVGYRLGIPAYESRKVMTHKGYNHSRYENMVASKYLYSNLFIKQRIQPLIRMYYLNRKQPGQKLLILCATRDFAKFLYEGILPMFTNGEVVKVFFAGSSDEYGNEENLNADVIISPLKSSGTGRDISKLITVINTISFKSQPLSEQVMGRLREIVGTDTIYVDMFNEEIPSQVEHMHQRKNVYMAKAASVVVTTL